MEKPIDMVLHCPNCKMQHIDKPEPERGWENPPHKSHLCHGCGFIFRPADIETNGVAATKTRGQNDGEYRPREEEWPKCGGLRYCKRHDLGFCSRHGATPCFEKACKLLPDRRCQMCSICSGIYKPANEEQSKDALVPLDSPEMGKKFLETELGGEA